MTFNISKSVCLFGVVLFIFIGCKDEDDPITPFIESISPTFGLPGKTVTIKGTRFDTNKANNTVLFNRAEATIESVTENQIIVKVPSNGATGNVTVITPNGKHVGPVFTYHQAVSMTLYLKVVDLTQAILDLEIHSLGSEPILEYGVIYSTNEINSISDGTKSIINTQATKGNYKVMLSPLPSGQKYFVRGYSITSDTTLLSNQVTFATGKIGEWFRMMDSFSSESTSGSGLVLNDKVYFSKSGVVKNEQRILLYEFDFTNYKSEKLNNCPAPYRDYYSSFGIGDTLYLGWGNHAFKKTGDLIDIWKYNVRSKTWKQGSDFPTDISGQYSFTINGKGYVLGYKKLDINGHNQLWEYNSSTGKWTKKTPPPNFEFDFPKLSFSTGERGFFIADSGNQYYLWEYNPSSDYWTKKSETSYLTSSGNQSFCLNTLNKVYVIDRNANGQYLLEYSIDNDSWKDLGVLPTNVVSGVILNNRIYCSSDRGLYVYVLQ